MVARPGQGDTPSDWFYSLPPITRSLMVAVVGTTCGVSFGMLNPGGSLCEKKEEVESIK